MRVVVLVPDGDRSRHFLRRQMEPTVWWCIASNALSLSLYIVRGSDESTRLPSIREQTVKNIVKLSEGVFSVSPFRIKDSKGMPLKDEKDLKGTPLENYFEATAPTCGQ